VVITAFMN